jgi:hypothetical protein
MLPETYFSRLTQAMGMQTDQRSGERRKAVRIPASFRPDLFPVIAGWTRGPLKVRARDISAGGIGLLIPAELANAATVVLSIKPKSSDDDFVILSALKRTVKLDGSLILGGFAFEKLLYPGQSVGPDLRVDTMLWVDIAGDGPFEDPYVQAPPASGRVMSGHARRV